MKRLVAVLTFVLAVIGCGLLQSPYDTAGILVQDQKIRDITHDAYSEWSFGLLKNLPGPKTFTGETYPQVLKVIGFAGVMSDAVGQIDSSTGTIGSLGSVIQITTLVRADILPSNEERDWLWKSFYTWAETPERLEYRTALSTYCVTAADAIIDGYDKAKEEVWNQ